MRFKCLNQNEALEEYAPFFFEDIKDERGRIAVADHSMARMGDPRTADDGLLYVSPEQTIVVGMEDFAADRILFLAEYESGFHAGVSGAKLSAIGWLGPILLRAKCHFVLDADTRNLIQNLLDCLVTKPSEGHMPDWTAIEKGWPS